jgi:hypothetical protein
MEREEKSLMITYVVRFDGTERREWRNSSMILST